MWIMTEPILYFLMQRRDLVKGAFLGCSLRDFAFKPFGIGSFFTNYDWIIVGITTIGISTRPARAAA